MAPETWLPRAVHGPIRKLFAAFGLDVQYFGRIPNAIPDRAAYQPRFRPWLLDQWQRRFAATRGKTLVTDDRLYVLASLLRQALATCEGRGHRIRRLSRRHGAPAG